MKICPRCNTKYEDKANVCNHDGVRLEKLEEQEAKTELYDQLIGTVLADRFKILSKLGQGGMGAVYKAEQIRMGRICAVKVIPEDMAKSGDAIERFNREAKMSALINDPHAVTVYDFGETEGGMYFLAMEYVEGETLSNLMRREGVLPLARVLPIVRQSGEALAAAHQQNVVHRDLKPDNIMIAKKEGQDWVKILDFGIAKISAEDRRNDLTRAGMVVGTPLYMSPEQLAGEKIDPRSDIYSFALIVYQMLSGGLPFQGDNAQAMMVKRLTDNPLPVSSVNPHVSVPPGVDGALMAALARERQMRTPTIRQFVEQIEQGARTAGTVITGRVQQPNTGQGWPVAPTGQHGQSSNPYQARSTDPHGYGTPSGPKPISGPMRPQGNLAPSVGPSGPQQATYPTPGPAYSPTPATPYMPMPASVGPSGPYSQPTPMPLARPKKSNRGLWIFGTIFLLIVLIGSCTTALFVIPNWNKPVSVDENGGGTNKIPQSNGGNTYTPTASSASDHYRRGVQSLDEKDYESAAGEFRQAVQAQPAYPEAQYNLAVALYKGRHFEEAAQEAQRANELYGGKSTQTFDLLGRALYDSGRYNEAARAFVQAFTLDKNDAEALALSGFSLQLAGQKELADKVYDSFLQLFPKAAPELVEAVRQVKEGAEPPRELPQD